MLAVSDSSMVSRSTPMPQPPVGGSPYSSAVQKFSSISCASSSPASLSCVHQRSRCGCLKKILASLLQKLGLVLVATSAD